MAKVKNIELATFISSRISEIMNITGMSLYDLSQFLNLNLGSLRSYYYRTLTISAENVAKICKSFSISMSDFFNPEIVLSIDLKLIPELLSFKEKQKNKFGNSMISYSQKTIVDSEFLKRQRDLISYLVYSSDYFLQPRTILEMKDHLLTEYNLKFTVERIYNLMRKFVGQGTMMKYRILNENVDDMVSQRVSVHEKYAFEKVK